MSSRLGSHLLEVKEVSKHFGGIEALKNVSFFVEESEIVGLVGPNGAGKSTLFNCVCGIYRPDSGVIKFRGVDITGLPPYKVCKMGIGRTFQVVKPFLNMTVLDNVMVAAMFGSRAKLTKGEVKDKCLQVLDFVGLLNKKNMFAKNLTLAEQRKLELARALATEPKLILLDEVLAGLNPRETIEALELIKKIRDEQKITILWVEHVVRAIVSVSDRMICLSFGEKIAEGRPTKVVKNRNVVKSYLGEEYEE